MDGHFSVGYWSLCPLNHSQSTAADSERTTRQTFEISVECFLTSLIAPYATIDVVTIQLQVIFPDSLGFQCKGCGVCCRDQPADINLKEQQRIEAKGFVDFLEDPNDPSNRSIRRKPDGSCIFFTEENTCKIHDVKPSICRLEPFVIKDFNIKTNRIFLALNPLAAKNCKGICRGEIEASEDITKAAQAIVEESLEIIAAKMGLPVRDRRVLSLARELLCL